MTLCYALITRGAPRPKTTCLPSSQGVTTVVMKNCDPFVSFPLFAIDSMPGLSCFSAKVSSCASAMHPRVKRLPAVLATTLALSDGRATQIVGVVSP